MARVLGWPVLGGPGSKSERASEPKGIYNKKPEKHREEQGQEGGHENQRKTRNTNRATQPEKQQTAQPDHHGQPHSRQHARATLITRVTVAPQSGRRRGGPEPSHEATTQRVEGVPERLGLVAGTHLVPIPHGKVGRSGTEQGVDILWCRTVSANDETFDAGMITQPSANCVVAGLP